MSSKKKQKKGLETQEKKGEYDPYGRNQDDLRTESGAVPVPKNFFVPSVITDVFGNQLPEDHKYEQFFWTKETVKNLVSSLEYVCVQETCCLMTPSLAHQWHQQGRDETLLDIDKRFAYLPKFRYFDVTRPTDTPLQDQFRLLVIDPPFFAIPVEQIQQAVDQITQGNFKTKIIIAFLLRAEKSLRMAFRPYKLVPTKFELKYASIKPNKWKNFVLYSNIDLPGIKRIKE